MKKPILSSLLILVVLSLLSIGAFAQNEQKGFSFQGYARDFDGAAYSSQSITAQFSIYPEGESVTYSEQHSLTTDPYGVFAATVGSITPVDFAAIDFTSKKYFLRVEVKVAGGDFVTISDTELLAVPYAKAAEKAVQASTAQSAMNGVPPGTILPFGGPVGNIPAGYLPCDGSSVTVSNYPDLYNAIGDSWGGDGGTNFNTPDLRGQFLRGQDQGSGVDPDAGARTAVNAGGNTGDAVGAYQDEAVKNPGREIWLPDGVLSIGHTGGGIGPMIDGKYEHIGGNRSAETFRIFPIANETRPKNAYVLFMIKY